MKAYVLHGIGDLRYEDVEKPVPEEDEVLVRVHAAGICGSDIPRIYRTGAYSYPLIPGHEFAGTVVEAGSAVGNPWIGKRVGVFPLIPCKECAQCQKKQYEMCARYSYLGSRTDGGFAEYVRVPVWNLLELPDGVSFEQAAMLEPMSVAVHAIRRAAADAGDRIILCGLGTIGLLAVMFFKGMGYHNLYVVGNKEIQKKLAMEIGVSEDRFCDIRRQDAEVWIMDATSGHGADVFFDCVGKTQTIEEAIRCTAAAGKVMLVGNPASDVSLAKDVYWKILRRQLTLMGTWNSSFTHESTDDWHVVLDLLQGKKIQPERLITQKYPMQQFCRGMERIKDKAEDCVKIMGYMQEQAV